jgi:hypothetical protein
VEAALVLSAFLTLILGMLDFGMATLNRNNLALAAHRLARAAVVRGEASAPELTPWGPAPVEGTAADGDEFAAAFAPVLSILPPKQVRFRVEWPDGGNDLGQRVRATVACEHRLIFGGFFGIEPWHMEAVSVMRIQH